MHEQQRTQWAAAVRAGTLQYGPAFGAWATLADTLEDLARFDEAYLGAYDDAESWARDMLEDSGIEHNLDKAVVGSLRAYVTLNYAAFAHDCDLAGDISIEPNPAGGVWIFGSLY